MAYDNSHDDIINHFKEECIKLNAKVDKIVEFKVKICLLRWDRVHILYNYLINGKENFVI